MPTSNNTTSGTSDFFGFTTPPSWNPATNIINGQVWLGSWWPTSGYRLYNSAIFGGIGLNGNYWSASPNPSNVNNAHSLSIDPGAIALTISDYRSYGLSVRCVQEERARFYRNHISSVKVLRW